MSHVPSELPRLLWFLMAVSVTAMTVTQVRELAAQKKAVEEVARQRQERRKAEEVARTRELVERYSSKYEEWQASWAKQRFSIEVVAPDPEPTLKLEQPVPSGTLLGP